MQSAATGAARLASPTATVALPAATLPAMTLPAARPLTVSTPVAAVASTWPLWALVEANKAGEALNDELSCVATAVYFESRGEPLEGQLAVAEVVMNRAQSGRYPASLCAVVKQPAQFSFVRRGQFPSIDPNCPHWAKAKAITRIAAHKLVDELPDDVLWYHADYVAPSWGRRLNRVEKIGAHIFYRG
ncbi:cell wall hydrolase [Sphingomonas sp. GCM10030256]|uniref:cell wall hydrolase n=1 Tax=Sphingomonas sp. GCM10030256 TaxID=3273427 RepID=UPI003611CE9F